LELTDLFTHFGSHPVVFGVGKINHVVLPLFGFPTTAQHVATHSAFEITQVAESIIPTHWTNLGKSITIRGPHTFFILVLKQAIEVTAIHICVQQFFIAYLTLGQGFSPHHSQSYTAHVRTIPMFS
jgi:hypothetical protein